MASKTAQTLIGDKIKFEGEITIPLSLNGITKKLKVFVLKNTENLFGSDWFLKSNHWDQPINMFCQKVECITAEAEKIKKEQKGSFPEVFSACPGKCTKITAKFELKENTRPIFRKKRNIPFASTKEMNKELDRLVNMGILSKVEFSEWAAPMVYIRKKSKEIRVCAEFSTGLNAALKYNHYPLPSPEEVFSKLNGGKVFSKIDLNEACLQIPVEENSSKLLSINTHRGLYKFDRLVFGIKVTPAIFQQVMDTMLGGFNFTFAYLDDIVISNKTKELHKEHLNKVFAQIRGFRFKVKEAKCDFYMNKIKYLEHIIDKDERRPDPERATDIKDMPAPDNVTKLQNFLGLANYYESFIKKFHDLRAPLNELLKNIKREDGCPNVKQHLTKLKRH